MANIEPPSNSTPNGPSTFPQEPSEFDGDPRISFSKLSSKFILETADGQEFEFDDALKRWIPVVRPHPPTRTMRDKNEWPLQFELCGHGVF